MPSDKGGTKYYVMKFDHYLAWHVIDAKLLCNSYYSVSI